MELRVLRYFVAVAEELHFGRAAARVHIAQPPLSQAIRGLEAELGTALFSRTSRHVALTPAGEELLGRARAILAAHDQAKAAVRRVGAGESGEIRIGFSASSAIGILPDIVRAYRARFPDVTLQVIEFSAAEAEADLLAGRFDLVIFRGPFVSRRVRVETLLRERLMLALPADHGLARKADLALADVAGEPFILFPRGDSPILHDSIVAACTAAGFSPRIVQEASSWAAVSSLVAAGIGVTLAPASARYLCPRGLVMRDVGGAESGAELAAAWVDGELYAAAEGFLVAARETLARIEAEGDG